MNRIIILGLAILASTVQMNGQVVRWLIPPVYDDLHMANGESIVVADSMDYKVLWSLSGRRLAKTEDKLFSYEEGYAVTTKRGSALITGFYDLQGNFTPLSGYNASYSMPYFSNQHLLVLDGNFYRFVDSKGGVGENKYAKAYPFFNGYASCSTFANLQKRKDPYNLLLSSKQEVVKFIFNGKQFDREDLEFVSSVNAEDIGVVVAKHKLYYFNGKDQSMSPIFAKKDETNLKNQAKLDDDVSQCLFNESDSIIILKAKSGKNEQVLIRFNQYMIPLSITLSNGEYIYKKNEKQKPLYDTPLRLLKEGSLCGISWEGQEILPPQLDELVTCFGDKAFVRLARKCGMLQVLKDEAFNIEINKNDPIAFRHQKFETKIRLYLPSYISAFKTRIEVDPNSGCYIDLPSVERKDTETGNSLEYNCVLSIPESLPDEFYNDSRSEIIYPIQVLYEGLKSPLLPLTVKAWHYKYFNVDVNEAETSINQGNLSFTFNINAERIPGESDYPTKVKIATDSLQYELEKISETRYKCKVLSLNEGVNSIVIQIIEQGCPPASFPFEVTYTRPSVKTKNKPAVKEGVVIKKKAQKQVQSTPHLDI